MSHTRYRIEAAGEPRTFPPEAMARIEKILKRYPTKQAALLPVLWVAQETWGWISKEAAEEVARILELPASHVDGVLTFYTMYNLRPVGQAPPAGLHLDLVPPARAPRALVEHCRKRLGIDLEETTTDGKFTLVEVECIAGCDKAPSMMVNDTYYEPMDASEARRAARAPRTGGLTWSKVLSARIGKPDSRSIDTYLADGGYASVAEGPPGGMTPEQVAEEVKKAGRPRPRRRGLLRRA